MAIRTPDQRLRVFVSSTLSELADERRAVSRAISTLRLTPVMFELGARPQPPRDVYRAYVTQSDVFIGLYWQRYGQVAPGMELSGIEDEFELSQALPRLLYVKAPAPDREPRLAALLSRIRQATSYRTFRTPTELGRLVRDDLATLLSERFAAASAAPPGRTRALPVATTPLFGREGAIDDVANLLGRRDARLVTLTGPGGIGKTRLALAVGERLRERFDAGTVFVPLATLTGPEQVVLAIARAVYGEAGGAGPPLTALVERLGDDRWLLILDNLEHVLGAARDLDELLTRCPGVAILATSLTAMLLRAEREYPVSPLPLPSDPSPLPLDELAAAPSVALFVERARAVRPDFSLTADNASDVVEICRRLEGLPLAIELAAARTRLLNATTLLARLATSLDALGTGAVDMPERQRTLRATVEWSMGLLDDAERSLLEVAAVFVDGWTVEAAATVACIDETRAFELTEALERHSLIELDIADRGPRARMLETIREFVAERLAERPDAGEIRHRHAEYFRVLTEQADRPLRSFGQDDWADLLQIETGNLDAAIRWYLTHEPTQLPAMFRVLSLFWGHWDPMGEARSWVDQLLASADALAPRSRVELLWTAAVIALEVGDDDAALAARERLLPLLDDVDDRFLHAVCTLAMAWSAPIAGDFGGALEGALAALEQLRDQDEPFWTAAAAGTAATVETTLGRYDEARRHLDQARNLAERFESTWQGSWSRVQQGILDVLEGRFDDARAALDDALDLSLTTRSTTVLTLCLGAFARLAFAEGDPERAALLAGSADGLRRRAGRRPWPTQRRPEAELAAQIRDALGADRFDQVFGDGARLSREDAVAEVAGDITR